MAYKKTRLLMIGNAMTGTPTIEGLLKISPGPMKQSMPLTALVCYRK